MKKGLKELSLFLAMILIGFTASCDKDNNDSPDPQPTPKITLPDDQKEFPMITDEGGIVTLKFSSATEWTLTPHADWMTAEQSEGKGGNQQVKLTVQPNATPDERTGTLTIRSGNVTETITLTQKQKDSLTLTSQSIELEETAGNFSIEVKANIKYEVHISNEEWIHPIKDRALTTEILRFQADANESEEERMGEIVISNGALKETFTIRQAGKKSDEPDKEPILKVSQQDFSIAADGGSISFDVESNVEYKVQPSADWILKDKEHCTGNHWVFLVRSNESTDARKSTIVLQGGGLVCTVNVEQSGKVSPDTPTQGTTEDFNNEPEDW